jgi:hypothetical protein
LREDRTLAAALYFLELISNFGFVAVFLSLALLLFLVDFVAALCRVRGYYDSTNVLSLVIRPAAP